MAELDQKDMDVLRNYARDGNRELYWNYLAKHQGSDGYGLLALGVVRNDSMPGAVANIFAQNYAKDHNGISLSERQWEAFGQDLVKKDFALRQNYANNGQPDKALNLPVADVQKAHEDAFRDKNIDANAWTPRQLLDAARRHGGEDAAQEVWKNMLNSENRGLTRSAGTLEDIWHYSDQKMETFSYLKDMTLAWGEAANDRKYTDPDIIGANNLYHIYDPKGKEWYFVSPHDFRRETDQPTLDSLNDARAVRLERQDKATRFDPGDPNKGQPIAKSPITVAEADSPQMAPQERTTQTANRQPLSGSTEDLFTRLTDAAMQGNGDAMRAVGQEFRQSEAGQSWMQSGRDYNQMQETLAAQQRESGQQQAQNATPERQGPAMRIG